MTTSALNHIGSVAQVREASSGNTLDVTQRGGQNRIQRISQYTTGTDNQTNTLTVTMSGLLNGSAQPWSGGPAAQTGAEASALFQGQAGAQAQGSNATLVIGGEFNRFGTAQYGQGNTIAMLTMSGGMNEAGIYQVGTGNRVGSANVSGSDNRLGIRQNGTENRVEADVGGSFNGLLVDQIGTDNDADVTIDGERNGWDRSFGGDAAALGLQPGLIAQDGIGNVASLTVDGSWNVFAFDQDGDGNRIEGRQDGDSNQVAIAQSGNHNLVNFTQIGGFNTAAVRQ
ncbi:hypothetical protein [Oceaniglobus roseus]|uniref:hypothetical protein n=1 Tax=Oceaniglobus roseus TaxID=1737570 RepID=UPI001C12ADBF|nr:hypothetical protein [Kandeliimicrobium roseum]